jgi:hypothetical protein
MPLEVQLVMIASVSWLCCASYNNGWHDHKPVTREHGNFMAQVTSAWSGRFQLRAPSFLAYRHLERINECRTAQKRKMNLDGRRNY